MAGPAHDVLVQVLRDHPLTLGALVAKLTRRRISGRLRAIDSTIRFARPAEVRPDIAYRVGRSWLVCEVQNKVDPSKRRRWLVAAGILHDATGRMGDLLVITASAAVARWARKVAHVRGPMGTSLRLSPIVLLLDERHAGPLLDPRRPELALFAAWAMQKRHGPAARRIVERALDVSSHLPPRLRNAQLHAILETLSERMRAYLYEATMHPDRVPVSPGTQLWQLIEAVCAKRARNNTLAEGKGKALVTVLRARGLTVSNPYRAVIQACRDIKQLDAWLRRAVKAESTADLLGPLPAVKKTVAAKGPAPKAAPRRRPASRPARTTRNGRRSSKP